MHTIIQTLVSSVITTVLFIGALFAITFRFDSMMRAAWKVQSRARASGRYFSTGFTLIELLVVVAIVGILAAFIIPAVNAARTKGAQAAAKNLDANFYHNLGDSLVGAWLMDDGTPNCTGVISGASALMDSSGYNNNGGTSNSGIAWSNNTPFGAGCSVLFNFTGTGGISMGTPSVLNISGDVTVSAWINPTDANNLGVIVREGQGVDEKYSFFYEADTHNLYFDSYTNSFNGVSSAANSVMPNRWTFVVVSRSGSTIRFYVNGAMNRSDSLGLPTSTSLPQFSIGGCFGTSNQYFAGSIDNVRIYDRALDTSEIQKLYAMDAMKHGYAFVGEYSPLVR